MLMMMMMMMMKRSFLLVLFCLLVLLLQPYTSDGLKLGEQKRALIGSNHPTCHNQCKGCTPCKPTIQTPIRVHPKGSFYYPLVWKCVCAGHFYNPGH
ncbi:hypothetical protein M5689_021700 [Euphorbia peplus]|nr:hypothetical protein M5689_021700 [Euphorbia peplus]